MDIIISKDTALWGLWHVTGDIRGFIQQRQDGQHEAVMADPYWGFQANEFDTLDGARRWVDDFAEAMGTPPGPG